MLKGGVEVGLLLQLHHRIKVLVINMGINSEQSLQNGLCHRHKVFGKWDTCNQICVLSISLLLNSRFRHCYEQLQHTNTYVHKYKPISIYFSLKAKKKNPKPKYMRYPHTTSDCLRIVNTGIKSYKMLLNQS